MARAAGARALRQVFGLGATYSPPLPDRIRSVLRGGFRSPYRCGAAPESHWIPSRSTTGSTVAGTRKVAREHARCQGDVNPSGTGMPQCARKNAKSASSIVPLGDRSRRSRRSSNRLLSSNRARSRGAIARLYREAARARSRGPSPVGDAACGSSPVRPAGSRA